MSMQKHGWMHAYSSAGISLCMLHGRHWGHSRSKLHGMQETPVALCQKFCMLCQQETCNAKLSGCSLSSIQMQSLIELAADGWHHGCMQVSQDEEKLQKARLDVKRGLPLQDLSGNKGFPEDARMQAQVRCPTDRLQLRWRRQQMQACRFLPRSCVCLYPGEEDDCRSVACHICG